MELLAGACSRVLAEVLQQQATTTMAITAVMCLDFVICISIAC